MSSPTAAALTPKNLPVLLKRGTPTKDILKMVKKAPKDVLSRRDDTGQTLLHVAAAEGELELVQKLVEKFKAPVEDRDKNDWRPLHSAAVAKKLNIMQFLLKQGASPMAANLESATALHYFARIPPPATAAEEPLYQDVLTRLIHKASHINIQNKSGQTALHKAVIERTERTLLINDLLAAKANVLLADSNGETAAHLAARNGNREVFDKLLKVGGTAILLAVSKHGETPFSVARSSNHEHLCSFISQWAQTHGISDSQLTSHGDPSQVTEEFSSGSTTPTAQTGEATLPTEWLIDDPNPDDSDILARRNAIRRQNIVKIILTGEQQVVQSLKWLHSILADPIKEHYSSFSISIVELNTLFNSELPTLYKKHRAILETLRTRTKEYRGEIGQIQVGDIFAELHALRPHYKIFAASAEDSVLTFKRLMTTNSQFAALVSKVAESSKNGPRVSDLANVLLSPLERVCSYPALLRDLQVVTVEGHPDLANLDLAMEYATQISSDILSVRKAAITKARITAIEDSLEGFSEELYKTGREFVFEESIMVKSLNIKGKQPPVKCTVYLFNDLILWARKAGTPMTSTSSNIISGPAPMLGTIAAASMASTFGTSLTLHSPPSSENRFKTLSYCASMSLKYVSTVAGTSDPDMKHAFEVSCEKENLRFVFGCDSDDAKLAWISRICNQVSRTSLYQMWNTQNNTKGPSKRVSHTATVVGSRLYVFGGQYQNHYYNDMYIFHLENREWTKVPVPVAVGENAAVIPTPRCEHSAVAVNSRIVYFGGFDGQKRLKDIYVFDTTTLKWMKPTIQSRRVPGARSGHKMVFLNNLVWLFGGIDSHGTYLNDIYTLNLEKWQWSAVPIEGKMPAPRAFHSMDVLKTKIAVFGGYSFSKCHDDVALLDIRKHTWTVVSGEELRTTSLATNLGMMGTGLAAASSKVMSGSTKLPANGMALSASSGSVQGSQIINSSSPPGSQLNLTSQSDSSAPQGRYHHASFAVDDYVLIQGGLAQGTASFCDLWALTTIDEQVVWHPVPVALQLDNRFRHSISAFKNKTSGKIQAIMFGGISGLATSTLYNHDVVIFKDMELMVSSLMKNYRRTVRKVAAISKGDLLAGDEESKSKWGQGGSGHPTATSRGRAGSPVIGRDRTPSSEKPISLAGVSSPAVTGKRPQIEIEHCELDQFDSLAPFALSSFNPNSKHDEYKLIHPLDSLRTMWASKHIPTNSALLITVLKKSRASHLIAGIEEIRDHNFGGGVPYYASITSGDDVWILQELALCSAASVVRTLGVTLTESSLSILARSGLETIAQIHKNYSSPSGICPEYLTLSTTGHLKFAHYAIFDFIRDDPSKNSGSKAPKDKDIKSSYYGIVFDAPEVFTAPEVYEARHNPNAKSVNGEKADIYSFGLSLLYLFTGNVPAQLLPSDDRANVQLTKLVPSVGTQQGEISSAFREFLLHTLEYSPSKRPLTKTLLDHSFVAAVKGSKPDPALVDLINLWRLYKSKGKSDGKPRDGYDMAKKFKPATDMPKLSPRAKKHARRSRSEASGLVLAIDDDLDGSTGSLRDLDEGLSDDPSSSSPGPSVSFKVETKQQSRASTEEISFRAPSGKHKRSGSDVKDSRGQQRKSERPIKSPKGATRNPRTLKRQNTYDHGSGAVVSRAYADDNDSDEDRGPMRDEDDDDTDDSEIDDRNSSVGPDDEDQEVEEHASLSQLRALQEEYMEVQQSTAENQSKMANELAELRMKLSTAQNELASVQAEFERRVEERIEREVVALRKEMAKEIETKVHEQRELSESRFARQLEMVKHSLGEEFKSLQRDLYRFVSAGNNPSSISSGGVNGSSSGSLVGAPSTPSITSASSGGGSTGGSAPPRKFSATPLWKSRPANSRTSQTSLVSSPATRSHQNLPSLHAADSDDDSSKSSGGSSSDFITSQGSSPALLSASAVYGHPKSLSDPVMPRISSSVELVLPDFKRPQTPSSNETNDSVATQASSSNPPTDIYSLASDTSTLAPPKTSSPAPSTFSGNLSVQKSTGETSLTPLSTPIFRSPSSEGMSDAARSATQKAAGVDVSKIWASQGYSPTGSKKTGGLPLN